MLKLRGLKFEEVEEEEPKNEETNIEEIDHNGEDEEPKNKESNTEEIDHNGKEKENENSEKVIAIIGKKENENSANHSVDHIKKTKTSYIFIHPDRTTQEQEEHRKLVTILRERKKKGEKNIFIKNGKITTYQPFRDDTQFNWV